MPTRYIFSTNRTRITCSRCNGYVEVDGTAPGLGPDVVVASAAGTDPDTILVRGSTDIGMAASDFIRWLAGRGRYHSWCRTCERETRRTAAADPNRATRRRAPRLTADGTARRHADRKFGVELELIFTRGTTRVEVASQLEAAGLRNWRVKSDGSLRGNGLEVVSPPLAGEAGMDEVQIACRVLTRMGAKPNRSCGLHVHHEINDLNVDALKRLAHAWADNQSMIDGLVSPSRHGNFYAQGFDHYDLERIDAAQTTQRFRALGIQRYKAMNFAAYGRYGTVEIRQHQGTCSFEKVRTWILFGQALVDTAKAGPVPATTRVRDLMEKLTTVLEETAKTYLLGRALEFGHATV